MGRMRGCIWLTAGLVVALLAGAIAFIGLERATRLRSGEGLVEPRIEVVVAARQIGVRSQLTAQDLELKEVPVNAVPETAVRDLAEAEGKITLVDLYSGEVLVQRRLLDPNVFTGDGRFALMVVEDQVLMAYPGQDLMSQVGVLKPGDHVDLLVSLDFPVNRGGTVITQEGEGGLSTKVLATSGEDEEQATFFLLQDVTVAAIVPNRSTSTSSRSGLLSTGSAGSGSTAPTPEPDPRSARGGVSTPEVYQSSPPAQVYQTAEPEAILFTLAPQDALLLKYAKDMGGVLDVVLRAPGTERPFDTDPVDVDYMIHRYQIPTQAGR